MRIPPDVRSNDVLTTVLDASSDLVVAIDANGRVVDVNASAERLLGWHSDSLVGLPLIEHIHPDDRTTVIDHLADVSAGPPRPPAPMSFRVAHAEGYWTTLELTGARRLDQGHGWSVVLILRDLTRRTDALRRLRQTAQELDFVASHDELTRLPSRQVLRARIGAYSRHVRPGEAPVRLIKLRVLHLHDLREQHGDDATTAAVRAFAQRVGDLAGDDGFVAADGPGEVVVVTRPGLTDPEVGELVGRLVVPFRRGGVLLRLGVATATLQPAQSAAAALDELTRSVAAGPRHPRPDAIAPASPRDRADPLAAARLRSALLDETLALWFQPIHDTRTGRVDAFEGLLRWVDPDGGVVTAGEFLPDVDGSSVMLDIDEFVFRTGCAQLAAWQRRLAAGAPALALNVSAERLRRGSLVELVHAELDRSGADPAGLCLEVTETHVVVQEPEALRQLRELRRLGVRLALDDFGTGYSSLHHLRDIRADELKIDRAFVELLGRDPGALAIVRATIEMGAAFGMVTTAEGVTTPDQRRVLQAIGCDRLQGFLFGPAVPASSADSIVDAGSSRRAVRSAARLQRIEAGRQQLRAVDERYLPSDEEVAAIAGCAPDEVRALEAPGRLEPADDVAGVTSARRCPPAPP